MESDNSHSEKVVEDFKRRKLAISAYRRIEELLRGFERERAADLRVALIGMSLVTIFLVYLTFLFFTTDSVLLS